MCQKIATLALQLMLITQCNCIALVITLPAHGKQWLCDRGLCLFIMYIPPESLNGTLTVDSPFQILAVDFSDQLYHCAFQKRYPH